ncbi:MAG: TRAP transporter small permease [Rhodospirillales bacterium]|jgi:TRAP-type C4-dicarboxylate transport system permease small subunit
MKHGSFYQTVCRLEAAAAAACLVAMVALVLAGAIARSLENPLNWTTDFATFFFAWAVFLSADVAWRKGNLMAFDLVTDTLSARLRRAIALVNLTIIAGFLAYVAAAGLWLSWISRARSFQGIPEISYSVVTLSLPVGASLLLATTFFKIRDVWADAAGAQRQPR